MSIADNAALSTGNIDFSLSAWVRLESKPVTTMDIVSKFEPTGNQREYRLIWNVGTDRFIFSISATGTTGTIVSLNANNLGSPSLATWYHIVAWHDSVANTLNIKGNDGTTDSVSHGTGVFNGTAPFHIGALGAASATNFWDGLIDEVGLWKRVLSAAEITDLYNGGSGRNYAYISGVAGSVVYPVVSDEGIHNINFGGKIVR